MNNSLYIRSSYSLLESLVKVDELVSYAKELNYETLALVDFNMHGAISFYRAMKAKGLKAVFALEIPYAYGGKTYHIALYAKNNSGLRHLYRISSLVNSQDVIIDKDILKGMRDDLLLIIRSDSNLLHFEDMGHLIDEFGSFYIGLVHNDYLIQKESNQKLKIKAKEYGIECLALPNTYYLKKEDNESFRALKAIGAKTTLKDDDLIIEENSYLLDEARLFELYERDDLANLDKIARLLVFEPQFEVSSLPEYKCPFGANSHDYLINLAKAGLKKRLKGQSNEEYTRRLNDELKVILKMHFEDYFLIVYDFILFAKKRGIMVGPGRGSAAGSLVAYCLGITDIDPLAYGLIFERFLNSERISMPDIDIDFPDDRRQEVIEYVRDKYGKDHTAHILTYGTLKTKQVLRDVARVLDYDKIDSLCKTITNEKMSLYECYHSINAFKERIDSDRKSRKLYDIALKLEGLPRHFSTHAAGIVISKRPLIEVVPLVRVEPDMYSIGVPFGYLEALGLIKIDFLGLKNLTVIAEIVNDIKRADPTFDIGNIPLDDKKTYDLICDVNTLGIFQLESSGMQNILKRLKPKTFIDIATTIALFRPGPMKNIPAYLENRKRPDLVTYIDERLRPILKETYGVIIYQEQIMMIATVLAGFSYAKADIMRRAMAKKDEGLLISLENEFISGAIENGVSDENAKKIYDLILRFANYGFNKSHSVAYALIAYRQSYLKANFPLYFYKALLNGTIASSNKTFDYLAECRKIDLKVAAPSINRSTLVYTIEKDHLRMPFGVIKNVGSISARSIVAEREKNGPFKSYIDAVMRLRSLGKAAIESLIDSGAFDEFLMARKMMKLNLADAVKVEMGMIIGDDPSLMIKMVEAADDVREVAENEKRVFGFALSVNPILEYKKRYGIETDSLYSLKAQKGAIRGFGQVTRIREHTTKNGAKMAFLSVSDDTDTLDLVMLPNTFSVYREALKEAKGRYVYFEGSIDREASCNVRRFVIKG